MPRQNARRGSTFSAWWTHYSSFSFTLSLYTIDAAAEQAGQQLALKPVNSIGLSWKGGKPVSLSFPLFYECSGHSFLNVAR